MSYTYQKRKFKFLFCVIQGLQFIIQNNIPEVGSLQCLINGKSREVNALDRSSPPEVFLRKGVLRI